MKTWVTSDLHLGHKNIIKYCHRPFKSLPEMNITLIKNWNQYISRHDHVYFLGDLAFAKHGILWEWLRKLNGHITFIKENHDVSDHIKFELTKFIKYNGISFFMIHDPKYVPVEWGGWVIHGHHHNNNLEKYPFINFENKTVNVSVDVTQYRPVDMDYIAKRIHQDIEIRICPFLLNSAFINERHSITGMVVICQNCNEYNFGVNEILNRSLYFMSKSDIIRLIFHRV